MSKPKKTTRALSSPKNIPIGPQKPQNDLGKQKIEKSENKKNLTR